MNPNLFGKNLDDLQNIGRGWARHALASSAKTFEATARYLDGLASRLEPVEPAGATAPATPTNGESAASPAEPPAAAQA